MKQETRTDSKFARMLKQMSSHDSCNHPNFRIPSGSLHKIHLIIINSESGLSVFTLISETLLTVFTRFFQPSLFLNSFWQSSQDSLSFPYFWNLSVSLHKTHSAIFLAVFTKFLYHPNTEDITSHHIGNILNILTVWTNSHSNN